MSATQSPPAATGRHKRRSERGVRLATALMGAALTVAAGCMALFRMGGTLVMLSYDAPFLVHRAGGGDALRMVFLNELDHDMLDRVPQARLLDRLREAGARAVIYDVIFDQPSADPQVDREFAAAIRRFRGVDQAGQPPPASRRGFVMLACGRKSFQVTGAVGEQLVTPVPVLLDAADGFGLVAVDDEAFGVRRLPTGTLDEPSMVWQTAVALGAALSEESRLDPRWINWVGPPPDPAAKDPRSAGGSIVACPAESLLTGFVDAGLFVDKIVIVGGEPGIVGEQLGKDLFSTPFHRFRAAGKLPLMSGVEVQANALANLLGDNWLTRSGEGFELMMVVAVGLLVGGGFAFLRPLRVLAAGATGIAVCAVAGYGVVAWFDRWFPWSVAAFLQIPVAMVWGIAAHAYVERFFRIKLGEEQLAIRGAFAKYLSPQMLERLTARDFDLDLGGEEITAAMMFSDLESFTSLCERIRDPRRIVETLNGYFQRTTGSIFDQDGVIIRYIGDGIFAAWGTPLPDPDAPRKAARAAWHLFENDKLVVDGTELRTRIGLHYGDVVAGNVGSVRRMDFTLMGDAVNVASRLETLNKALGTNVLMSEAISSRLDGEFRTRRVGRFRVKGKIEVTVVHELLGPPLSADEPAWIADYHRGIEALEANDVAAALDGFRAADAKRGPRGDGPSRFFIHCLESGQSIPDGIVEMTERINVGSRGSAAVDSHHDPGRVRDPAEPRSGEI